MRYIALVALVKIAPTHPHLISTHHDTILNCVDDPDLSIRMRALDLVEVMVSVREAIRDQARLLITVDACARRPTDKTCKRSSDGSRRICDLSSMHPRQHLRFNVPSSRSRPARPLLPPPQSFPPRTAPA